MTMADRIVVMHDGIVEQIGTPLELFDRPGQPVRGAVHRLAGDELKMSHAWRQALRSLTMIDRAGWKHWQVTLAALVQMRWGLSFHVQP
jgi:ABC-type sulfate/molybdate transport systems ATPase subunit